MNRFYKHLIFWSSLASLVACESQIEQTGSISEPGADLVSFKVGQATETKAGYAPLSVIDSYDLDGSDLELRETVQILDSFVETKGVPVYTENITDYYASLAVTAFNVKESVKWGETDVKFDLEDADGRVYSHNYSKGSTYNLNWPEDSDLRFFVRAPYFQASDPCSGLTYSLSPSSALAQFNYTTPATAADQKDVLFGSEQFSFENKTSADNVIKLHHVLTGVKFKVSSEAIEKNVVVKSVKFSGVVKSAACEVETISDAAFDVNWIIGATPVVGDFSQEFGDELVTADKSEGFAESFYKGETYVNNLNDKEFSLTFWFIPQSLDNVKATITYTIGGGNEQSSTVSFGTGKNWNAGELHTYTLSPKGAGIVIDDDCEGQVKSDVVITNTGNMPEYIRVAVVANWVNAAGVAVQSMVPDLGVLGSNWIKKGAYYYYIKEVNPGMQPGQADASDTSIDYLFDTYTVPVDEAPEGADHLEMALAVQAIDTQSEKNYVDAWKNAGVEVK